LKNSGLEARESANAMRKSQSAQPSTTQLWMERPRAHLQRAVSANLTATILRVIQNFRG